MLRRSLAESTGHFWWPAEFENVANPYFENLKHLQNPGHLSLTAYSKFGIVILLANMFVGCGKSFFLVLKS